MIRKDKNNNYPNPDILDNPSTGVASAMDNTGLLQGLPEEHSEIEALDDLGNMPEQGALEDVEEEVELEVKDNPRQHKQS